MTIERLLNSIGKATFIKYYYSFKTQSRDYCINHFEENYTYKAKSSKTGHAQTIFRNGLEKEALIIISNSARVDSNASLLARDILAREFGISD